MDQVKYTQKDILDRVFKQKRMGTGYDPADVDNFLDDIIKDYGVFSERIEQLRAEVARLQTTVKQAQTQAPVEPVAVSDTFVSQAQQAAPTNLDLIKRVANLERAVFGRDNDHSAY